jgi:hydrogenase expression/formation protein HypE
MKITSAHGGGGKMMNELIKTIFEKNFSNEILNRMEDSAVLQLPVNRIAFTTDSFVVSPLFFKGGDIGRLSVCGTVNDLSMRGAAPKYLSAGFILEEGLDTDVLKKVAASMQDAAREAGVMIVTGDTKVIEGKGGLYINTAGIGMMETGLDISASNAREGDAVIISGDMGNHHACILSARMNIQNGIVSDCAPLNHMVQALLDSGVEIHTMRDITRGGLGTVLHEIALASKTRIALSNDAPLADDHVSGFCDILGLDPMYMGNEGKMALILPQKDAGRAVDVLRGCKYGAHARIVGEAVSGAPGVTISTRSGATRFVEPLPGEGLPRIC